MVGYVSSKAKLTKRVVDATAPSPEADVIVWDTEVVEFRLRVRPTGRKVYEVRYRPKGLKQQRQITVGVHGSPWTVEEARDRAKDILREVHGGTDPLEAKTALRASLTVSELIEVYLTQGPAFKPDKRASSWEVDRYNLTHHAKPLLGRKIARELTPADLAEWQAKVALGVTAKREPSGKKRGVTNVTGGPGAAAKAIRVMSTMLEFARLRKLLPDNPGRDVEKIADGVRERYLPDEEAAAIWSAIDDLAAEGQLTDALVAAFRLLLLTGARIGEISNLRWSEVDLRRGLLLLPPARHKSGGRSKPKALQLPAPAIDVLARLRADRTEIEFLFPAQVTRAKRAPDGRLITATYANRPMARPKSQWNRVLKRAGVTDSSFHVIRHTFASQVISDGAGIYTLSKLLGHARSSTTERYAHLRQDAGAVAVEGVAGRYASPNAPNKKKAG
ncbi:Tyrosine recombinase XerD [compost metagenome]